VVVGGSLSKGLEVKLDRDTAPRNRRRALSRVQGQSRRSLDDHRRDARRTDPRWAKVAPDMRDDFMAT